MLEWTVTVHLWQTAWLLFPGTSPPSFLAAEGYLEKRRYWGVTGTRICPGMLLTSNTPDNQDLLGATVSHSPLCDLHQHREDGLLYTEGHVRGNVAHHSRGLPYIKGGCLFFSPAGRNTSPLPYTGQNSASCGTCPVEEAGTGCGQVIL